jgi:hypothetical protein
VNNTRKFIWLLAIFVIAGATMLPNAYSQGGGATAASGEAPSPEDPPPPPPPQQPGGAAPPRRAFTGSITGGMSLESGRTDLNGVQIDFAGQKPYSRGAFTTGAIYTYARTRPRGLTQRFTAADRFFASAGIEHNLGRIPILMTRTMFLRDEVASVHHRIEQMGGIGANLSNDRVRFRIVPGVSFLNQDRGRAQDSGNDTYYGVYEDFSFRINPFWTFTQYFFSKRDFSDPHDYIFDGKAALTGMVTRRLGMQLSYYYAHENILPPGAIGRYQKVMAGLQVKF